MPYPPPASRRVSRASPARGAASSTPCRTLAAAVLLAITGGLALPATAQAQESEFLFRTTVHMGFVDTQATYTIISYADGAPNGTHATAYGGIGQSGTFTHDSDEYVIEAVVYSHGTILGPDSLLELWFSPGKQGNLGNRQFRESLTLHIGSTSFPMVDATHVDDRPG